MHKSNHKKNYAYFGNKEWNEIGRNIIGLYSSYDIWGFVVIVFSFNFFFIVAPNSRVRFAGRLYFTKTATTAMTIWQWFAVQAIIIAEIAYAQSTRSHTHIHIPDSNVDVRTWNSPWCCKSTNRCWAQRGADLYTSMLQQSDAFVPICHIAMTDIAIASLQPRILLL